MKIAIIGSTGFIGKNIYKKLYKNPELEIIKFSSFNKYKNRWIGKIKKDITKERPNLIINCSADQNLNTSNNELLDQLNSNLYSNIFFLKESLKYKNFKGYISFGTKWELINLKNKKLINFYTATKKANDIFFNYFSNFNAVIISLKIFDTYGRNDKRKKLLNQLKFAYKNQTNLKITEGKQYLDYVHINDLCELVEKIIFDIKNKKISGFKTFTVSSGKPIRLLNFISFLNKTLKKKIKISFGKKYRKNEFLSKIKKFNNYPSWKPKVDFKEEIKKIFEN